MHLLHQERGLYDDIEVYETNELFGRTGRFRCLRFADGAVQGAIDRRHPERVVLAYQQAVLSLMRGREDGAMPDSLFVLGHGIGTIAERCGVRHVKVAEADPAIADVSRRFFGANTDRVAIGDGRGILAGEPDGAYDCIVFDAFTARGTPPHLATAEAFATAAAKLAPGGLLLLNAIGKPKGDRFVEAVHATAREAFRWTKAYFVPGADDPGSGNVIVAAGRDAIGLRPRGPASLSEIPLGLGHVMRDRDRPPAAST